MQPKLIRTQHGYYLPAEWSGTNDSCIEPFGETVLVLTDPFSPKSASGLLEFTEEMIDRASEAAETGVIVAVSEQAWTRNRDRTGPYIGKRPTAGQRVIFLKYSGSYHWGADGRRYRLMEDTCIGGLVHDPKPASSIAKVTKPPLVRAGVAA